MKKWYDRLHERFASPSIHRRETAGDVRKWQEYISSFPDTDDCIRLSYYRYQCRMYHFTLWKRAVMNILGFFALFVELFYVLRPCRSLQARHLGLTVLERARDIPDFSDIVPKEIFADGRSIKVIDSFNSKFGTLCAEARSYYLRCLKAHPFSFFYVYFVYMELVTHSYILLAHNPEITFVYINERNIASPILTELYERQGRKFMSFMHGEFPMRLIQAFMSFSCYYVWDESYIDMFSKHLRCKIHHYQVYTPDKLRRKWHLESIRPDYFMTYYFSGEEPDAVIRAVEALKSLQGQDRRCKVRPHPRNKLNLSLLSEVIAGSDIELEDVSSVSLEESLARSEYAAGLQSTVLSEAYIEGRKIVIDDVSDPEHFSLLKSQQFIIFRHEHILFSELMRLV